jgi:hypothetical protein
MSELAARKCKPCEGGIAPLTAAQAGQLLAPLIKPLPPFDARLLASGQPPA